MSLSFGMGSAANCSKSDLSNKEFSKEYSTSIERCPVNQDSSSVHLWFLFLVLPSYILILFFIVERGQPSTIKAVSNLLICGGRNRHCLLRPWNKSCSLNESSVLSLYNWGSLWQEGWVCQGWLSLSTQAPCLELKLGVNISWVLRTMQQKYTYLKRGGGWFFTVRRKRECWISHQWCLLHKETDYIVGLSGISTVTGREFLSWVKSEIMSCVQLFFFLQFGFEENCFWICLLKSFLLLWLPFVVPWSK